LHSFFHCLDRANICFEPDESEESWDPHDDPVVQMAFEFTPEDILCIQMLEVAPAVEGKGQRERGCQHGASVGRWSVV